MRGWWRSGGYRGGEFPATGPEPPERTVWHYTPHAGRMIGLRGLDDDEVLMVLMNPDLELTVPGSPESGTYAYTRDGVYVIANPITGAIVSAWVSPTSPHFPRPEWRRATAAELTCPYCGARLVQLEPGDRGYDPDFPVQTRHEPADLLACPGPREIP